MTEQIDKFCPKCSDIRTLERPAYLSTKQNVYRCTKCGTKIFVKEKQTKLK